MLESIHLTSIVGLTREKNSLQNANNHLFLSVSIVPVIHRGMRRRINSDPMISLMFDQQITIQGREREREVEKEKHSIF